MKRSLVIEGMVCSHCAARVEQALGVVAGVSAATVELSRGTAYVEGAALDGEALKGAVEAAGYRVLEIH